MKLSTRARYGTRALLDLGLHQNEAPVALRAVAERQDVSLQYLEHLIAPLIAAGIVRTVRGPGGGVSLVKPLSQIRLGDVVSILEGSIDPVECVGKPGTCSRSGACSAREIWGQLRSAMKEVLDSTTLQDLVERQKSIEQREAPMYHI